MNDELASVNLDYGNLKIPVVGDEKIMKKKAHGTSSVPVMKNLRFGVDYETSDRICNFNRHYAERSGYFLRTKWRETVGDKQNIVYYDANDGKPLFVAPRNRTPQQFLEESTKHGWPSFRDDEVVWDNVRVLPNGETVSLAGTHLGHNIPDRKGNRYCINLVCIAGSPQRED